MSVSHPPSDRSTVRRVAVVAALWLVTLVTVIAALVAMRLPLPFWSTTAIVLLCSVVGGVCAGIASGIITDLLHERRDRRGVPE